MTTVRWEAQSKGPVADKSYGKEENRKCVAWYILKKTWGKNLEIGFPVDVDEKGRAHIIVPVWLGKECGKTTVFILVCRHSVKRKREPRSCGEKNEGSMCLFLDIVPGGKRSSRCCASRLATEPRHCVSSVRGPRHPKFLCGLEPLVAAVDNP